MPKPLLNIKFKQLSTAFDNLLLWADKDIKHLKNITEEPLNNIFKGSLIEGSNLQWKIRRGYVAD